MTETEYIAATNLAKIRCALASLRDVMPDIDGVVTQVEMSMVTCLLHDLSDKLHERIKTQPTTSPDAGRTE